MPPPTRTEPTPPDAPFHADAAGSLESFSASTPNSFVSALLQPAIVMLQGLSICKHVFRSVPRKQKRQLESSDTNTPTELRIVTDQRSLNPVQAVQPDHYSLLRASSKPNPTKKRKKNRRAPPHIPGPFSFTNSRQRPRSPSSPQQQASRRSRTASPSTSPSAWSSPPRGNPRPPPTP